MRYAIISDIHSNLEALTVVMAKIDSLGVDGVVCLGDIVGYNANPNECIDILAARGVPCIMGNHDERAAGLREPDGFNPFARKALLWTREHLTDENKSYLAALPRTLIIDGAFFIMHGTLDDTDHYLDSAEDAAFNFQLMREDSGVRVGFFGHTHVPIAYIGIGAEVITQLDDCVHLDEGCAYLVNPGSVGQPRNHDSRASFALYDTEAGVITFHKVDYDISLTASKILEAGLPERLAERLRFGV